MCSRLGSVRVSFQHIPVWEAEVGETVSLRPDWATQQMLFKTSQTEKQKQKQRTKQVIGLCRPVIQATWEAEEGGPQVQGQGAA